MFRFHTGRGCAGANRGGLVPFVEIELPDVFPGENSFANLSFISRPASVREVPPSQLSPTQSVQQGDKDNCESGTCVADAALCF
jgi:hypothetical protein